MKLLLALGFVLSLDSFRVSLGLGALKLRATKQIQIVLAFGLCDALAPLVGLLIGKSIIAHVGAWAEHLGPLLLCAYGAYVIYVAIGWCWACRSPLVWTISSRGRVWA